MPIIPSHKNPLLLLRSFRDELEARTNITNFDRDSKARAFSDAFIDDMLAGREDLVNAFYSMQIANAVDAQLDQIGEDLGLPRLQPTFANALSVEQNVAFYVDSTNFGTINGGSPITVPGGTRIESLPNQNELNTRISFELLEDVLLPAADSLKYVAVRATTIGTGYNVGAEVLRSHTFTGYTDVGSNSLKVVNFYPILNGRNRETDEHYKYRLSQYYNTLFQANDARIRLRALEVPGVREVKIIPGYYGIGTAGVVVLGPENQSNSRLVNGVQEQLRQLAGPGQELLALGATQVLFDFELDVRLSILPTISEQARITAQIQRGILAYFRKLPIGGTVNLDDLVGSIQRITSGVVSLSGTSKDKFFKRVFLRRAQPGFISDDRELLIANTVTLLNDQFGVLGTLEVSYS